jgi:hypothetical protein
VLSAARSCLEGRGSRQKTSVQFSVFNGLGWWRKIFRQLRCRLSLSCGIVILIMSVALVFISNSDGTVISERGFLSRS